MEDPTKTLDVNPHNRLFCACYCSSHAPSTPTSSSPRLEISCQLQGIHPDPMPCQDLIFCSCVHLTGVKDADHLSHPLAQQDHSHPKQGLEGLLAALTWLCTAQGGNNTDCMVWRAEASWSGKVNTEEKEEPPHHHLDIVIIEMDAGIFLTQMTEAHRESARPAREVCIIKQQILSRCPLQQNTVAAYLRWSCSKPKNV